MPSSPAAQKRGGKLALLYPRRGRCKAARYLLTRARLNPLSLVDKFLVAWLVTLLSLFTIC